MGASISAIQRDQRTKPGAAVIKFRLRKMPSPLTALSPLDGRYAAKTRALQEHFSELALIRHRVRIEVEWLKALADEPAFPPLPSLSAEARSALDAAAAGFSLADAERVKALEAVTNHDV